MKIQKALVNSTERYDDRDQEWETIADDIYEFISMLNNEELDVDNNWYRIKEDNGDVINL